MDARKLETTRKTAIDPVQRCTPACPSSTSCRFRRARRKLREGGKPCTHARAWYTRFVLEVERSSEGAAPIFAFDLLQAANDAALLELLLDGCTKRQADLRAFAEEASKAERPGPLDGRPRQSVAKNRSRSDGRRSMRLTERKRILIDIRRAQHPGATFASPPAELSLAKPNLDSAVERGCRVHSLGTLGVLGGSNAFSRFIQWPGRIYMT